MSASIKKICTVTSIIAFVAFLAFAGFTTYSVNHLSRVVDEEIAKRDAAIAEIVAARTATDPNDVSGNNVYTEPLGVTSEDKIAAITIPSDAMSVSLIATIACLGIFAISLAIFLFVSNRAKKKRY